MNTIQVGKGQMYVDGKYVGVTTGIDFAVSRGSWGRSVRAPKKLMAPMYSNGTRKNPVLPCGHKIDPRELPKRNCDICWSTVLAATPKDTKVVLDALDAGEERLVVGKLGKKAVKYLRKFRSPLLAHFANLAAEEQARSAAKKLEAAQNAHEDLIGKAVGAIA